jgi:FAD/FMN-containing dehydrogenase
MPFWRRACRRPRSAPPPRYLEEPRGRWHGPAWRRRALDTEEVAAVIRACAATHTPVIPFGGGTGLVGGQLAEEGAAPVILSLERMRAVRALDAWRAP